jgi:PilZ domain
MTAKNLQPVAEQVVRRAKQQGHVLAREVREELTRAGVAESMWKDVLALARASLSYRKGRYYYTAPVSERVRAQQTAIHSAVTRLTQQHAARRSVERREQGRIDFIQPVKVVTEDGREFTLLSRDLSATGIRLIGTRRLLGQKVRVQIAAGGETVDFQVRILWTCPVGDDLVENGGTFLTVGTT